MKTFDLKTFGIIGLVLLIIGLVYYSLKTDDIEQYENLQVCDPYGSCITKAVIKDDSVNTEYVMAKLSDFGEKLIEVLDDSDTEFPSKEKKNRINLLKNRYKFGLTTKIEEVVPGNLYGYTSYTENKGTKMGICLRQKDLTAVQENDLKFVFAHELAHIATVEQGHTPIFWNNFNWILKYAYKNNLLKYVDYSRHPAKYCGITISSNPFPRSV